jgi:hypothetical protein
MSQFVKFGGQVFHNNDTQAFGTECLFKQGKVDIVWEASIAVRCSRDIPQIDSLLRRSSNPTATALWVTAALGLAMFDIMQRVDCYTG